MKTVAIRGGVRWGLARLQPYPPETRECQHQARPPRLRLGRLVDHRPMKLRAGGNTNFVSRGIAGVTET